MSALKNLEKVKTLSDVATLLGYKPKFLSYILYKIPNEDKYIEFEIPKKSGGVRKIKAPVPQLKHLQKHLADLLSKCLEEMCLKGKKKDRLSHGFRKNRTIVTNASRHQNKRHVFNTDLKDFFPSINLGRVRGFFIHNNHFKLDPQVATIFAQIACHDNELPQGSPCSPVISNLIGHLLDIRMSTLASKAKCVYSRYADDLTFSTNVINFPDLIAKNNGNENEWITGKALHKEIAKVGFQVNEKKSSLQHWTRRQVVTGLVVNKKVNIKQDYYKNARSMCHALFQSDEFYLSSKASILQDENVDQEPQVQTIEPGGSETTETKTMGKLSQLEGILNHIYQVKAPYDDRNVHQQRKSPSAIMKLYREFLFYKHFFALKRPLIICEGKTDPIYLKCALRQLADEYPGLIEKTDKGYVYNISFLNFSETLKKVFAISEGTSALVVILNYYRNYMKRFKGDGKGFPVIMLIDNDDGSKEIKKIIKKLCHYDPKKPYTHCCENLYMVHTPIGDNDEETAIEDLFDEQTLAIKVEGKTFNRGKEINPKTEYGKIVFAKRVVNERQNEINFDGFKQLLTPFVAVMEHYKQKKEEPSQVVEEPSTHEPVKKKKKVKTKSEKL